MKYAFDLNPDTPTQNRIRQFTREYKELCEKYNLTISGCGCCGSPFLTDLHDTPKEFIMVVNYDLRDDDFDQIVQKALGE